MVDIVRPNPIRRGGYSREVEPPQHLYIHIPFCPRKCDYCAFVTHIGSQRLAPEYVRSLALDMCRLAAEYPGGPLDTVYFGGGTPSMLTPEQIAATIAGAEAMFGLAQGAEVTLECHPDTVDEPVLARFRAAGVTRVSFGAESLQPEELAAIGRSHSVERVVAAVEGSKQAGFASVALDLMYGLPGQTLSSWLQTLDRALALQPDHLSLYPLSIEPATVFARLEREQRLRLPGDDTVVEMYHSACAALARAGYEHYEVANWATRGHRCRHNLAYWRNRQFYAVGVGAHGYLGNERTENVRQTRRYIEILRVGDSPVVQREPIDPHTERSERIMLQLRLLIDGLDLAEFDDRYGGNLLRELAPTIEQLRTRGLLLLRDGRLRLPEHAVPLANEVFRELM